MIPKRLVHGTVGFVALFRLARPDFDWLKLMVLGIQTSRNPTDSFKPCGAPDVDVCRLCRPPQLQWYQSRVVSSRLRCGNQWINEARQCHLLVNVAEVPLNLVSSIEMFCLLVAVGVQFWDLSGTDGLPRSLWVKRLEASCWARRISPWLFLRD